MATARRATRCFRRGLASLGEFERKAANYWTQDRALWLSNGRDLPLSPDKPGVAGLLRVLGLLNPDGSMSHGSHRKYHQINQMHLAIERALTVPLRTGDRHEPLRLVDLCTGSSSHVALLLAFSARTGRWERPAHVLAIDADATRIEAAKNRARLLGFGTDTLHYRVGSIRNLEPWPSLYAEAFSKQFGYPAASSAAAVSPHGVFALHACDTATDEALAFGVESGAEALLVAPCCQSELAAAWKSALKEQEDDDEDIGSLHGGAATSHQLPLASMYRMPHMRRELASTVTDSLRVLLMKACGYTVRVGEFVSSEHTPKNTLITATRQRPTESGRVVRSARSARASGLAEYKTLRDATGGRGIALGRLLGVEGG